MLRQKKAVGDIPVYFLEQSGNLVETGLEKRWPNGWRKSKPARVGV
ncbi:MAG: hypothetical protein ACOYYS_16215 [Chloroflexota bacterium]